MGVVSRVQEQATQSVTELESVWELCGCDREEGGRTREHGLTFGLGILVDKDDLIKYQLVINYELLVRIFTYQPTVDKTIVLSTNC